MKFYNVIAALILGAGAAVIIWAFLAMFFLAGGAR